MILRLKFYHGAGVGRVSVFSQFKMQVGTGAIAAGAHIANNLALFYIGTSAYS